MTINYNYKIDEWRYIYYLQYVQSRWGLRFTFNISYETIENIHVELKNFTFHIQIGKRRQNDKDAQKISLVQTIPDKN